MAVDPRVEQLRPMVEPALKSGQTASHGDCRSRRVEGTTVRSSSDVGGVLGSTVLGDHTDLPGLPASTPRPVIATSRRRHRLR